MEVYFEAENDVVISEAELVSHVRDALRSVALGDTDNYNQLIGYLAGRDEDEVALLITCLKALAGAVSSINIDHHEALLSCIFDMSLWNYGQDVMDALVDLVVRLATSSGEFVDLSLNMLVRNFTPPRLYLHRMSEPHYVTRKTEVLNRVHSALESIEALVPLAPLRLSSIVRSRMPSRFVDKEGLIIMYVENMLRLESSVIGEIVGSKMLTAVMDELVLIDVDIEWDDIMQDDCDHSSKLGIFDMELDGDNDDIDDSIANHCLGGNKLVGRLDCLMVLTFEHLKSSWDSGRLRKVFETLLQSFEDTVLTSYKSKFAQFVIFYACSLDPETCGVQFATMLMGIFESKTNPSCNNRMSAVAYLASYLSRAKFLPISVILSTLKGLVDWCIEYCRQQDSEEKSTNPKYHQIFYSGCQAVMYILCFRMRAMWDVPHLKSQILQFPLQQILQHPLNPLKVCLPSIVEEFMRQAVDASLFTSSENFILNNVVETDFSKAFGGKERLDMFFPFDPCLLKQCDKYIRPNYVYWASISTTYDGDQDVSSDKDGSSEQSGDEDYDDFSDDDMDRNFGDLNNHLDDVDKSLNQMLITPKSYMKYDTESDFNIPMRMPARIRPSTSPESF